MKILYICGDQGIPVFGRKGASTHIREMIAALRAMGHQVCLAAPDLGGDRRANEDWETVKLPAPSSRKLGLDGRYFLASLLARRALMKVAERFRPDAIYERSALYFTAGEWLAKKLRLPRVLEINALLAEEQKGRLHFAGLAARIERNIVMNAPRVAAISSFLERQLHALGKDPKQVRVFTMAVDPARFHPIEDSGTFRRSLGWPEDVLILGYIGSMNHYHRPSWFMDLAEKFYRREQRGVRFLVVGGSSAKVERHRGRLVHLSDEDIVRFAGSVPQEQISQWMSAMDAVLVPGAAPQSTPTKIFEAAAVGRPMILPATEPIRELCGADAPFLFKANDFRAFEEKVKEFCAAREKFVEPARKLREKIMAEHTWARHAENVTRWLGES